MLLLLLLALLGLFPVAQSQMVVQEGSYLFRTHHSGQECLSTPSQVTVDQRLLNQCLPPDETTKFYHRLLCKQSANEMVHSVFVTAYRPNDSTCSAAPLAGPLLTAHTRQCSPDPLRQGHFTSSRCGDIPVSLKRRTLLMIKAFPQTTTSTPTVIHPICSPSSEVTRFYVLGVCAPLHPLNGRLHGASINITTDGSRCPPSTPMAM